VRGDADASGRLSLPPQKAQLYTTTQPTKQIPKFRFESEMLQLIRVVLVVHAPADEVARNKNS
jgi:hypothetical protein